MNYEFDPSKNDSNYEKHGVWLEDAYDFKWDTCVISEDTRKNYQEERFEAIGYIDSRLHVMIYCRRGNAIRVISLRKANKREVTLYAQL